MMVQAKRIDAGVYCSTTASMLLKGKGYNRGVQASKLLMKAFFHLQWQAFAQWLSDHDDCGAGQAALAQDITIAR